MSTDVFKASVQYGDYKGTTAADDHGDHTISDYMNAQGLKSGEERILGLKLWSGEVHGSVQNQPVGVTAYLIASESFEEVRDALASTDPVIVKEVRFEVSLEQFFGLFKRFEIAITRFDELNGRELLIKESAN